MSFRVKPPNQSNQTNQNNLKNDTKKENVEVDPKNEVKKEKKRNIDSSSGISIKKTTNSSADYF